MSILANVLTKVFDYEYNGKKCFTHKDWAFILGVPEEAVEEWISDKTLPSAVNLRSIKDIVGEDTRMPELYDEFCSMLVMPARDATPHWKTISSHNLGNYIVWPVINGFIGTLETLPPELQEKVLFAAAKICRELREQWQANR